MHRESVGAKMGSNGLGVGGAGPRGPRLDVQTVTDVLGLILLLALVATGLFGIRQATDTPLDRVDPALWPYLHH